MIPSFKEGDKVICTRGDNIGDRGTVISVPTKFFRVRWDKGGDSAINVDYVHESIGPAPMTIAEAALALLDNCQDLNPYTSNLRAALKRGV